MNETQGINVLPSSVFAPETFGKWPGIENGSIAQVVSTRLQEAAANKSVKTRYCTSSSSYDLDRMSRSSSASSKRHWCIENKLHRVIDITYGQDYVQCKNDDALRGVTTLNKVMYNFTSAAQGLPSKEYCGKVSMRSLKPHSGSATEILKLIAKICVHMRGKIAGQRTTSLPLCQLCKNRVNFPFVSPEPPSYTLDLARCCS